MKEQCSRPAQEYKIESHTFENWTCFNKTFFIYAMLLQQSFFVIAYSKKKRNLLQVNVWSDCKAVKGNWNFKINKTGVLRYLLKMFAGLKFSVWKLHIVQHFLWKSPVQVGFSSLWKCLSVHVPTVSPMQGSFCQKVIVVWLIDILIVLYHWRGAQCSFHEPEWQMGRQTGPIPSPRPPK